MTFLPRTLSLSLLSLVLLALPTVSVSMAQTQQATKKEPVAMTTLLRCTHDEALVQALRLMSQTPGAQSSFHLIADAPVRVVFKDMKTLGKGLANYDALSWISNQGEQVIFVNEKHRQAPPQALAAMLSHEAMHNDPYNSLNEEVAGWQEEASVWQAFKKGEPVLDAIAPGTSALVDRENRLDMEAQKGTLDAFVRNNPGYRNLPDKSPGFGIDRTAIQGDAPSEE
jgi:hypothetical protein